MQNRLKLFPVLIALVALSLLLTGCGNRNNNSSAPDYNQDLTTIGDDLDNIDSATNDLPDDIITNDDLDSVNFNEDDVITDAELDDLLTGLDGLNTTLGDLDVDADLDLDVEFE